jgi:X-Pro dipeptidyl-peptidase
VNVRLPQGSFTDDPAQTETQMVSDPEVAKPNRLVFLSEPLKAPLHVSGTPEMHIEASADKEDTNLGTALVDYGSAERVAYRQSGEGIRTLTTEDCWGESSPNDDPCYRQTVKNVATAPFEVVTKGILDALNRNSLTTPEPLVPGETYAFRFPLLPEDYVFEAGHRVGVIVVGSYRSYGSEPDQTRATITLHGRSSRIQLPIVGGHRAAVSAGLVR